MASMVERMIGAARLDARTFEEIEHDPTSIGQSLGVVVIAAAAAGIGGVGRAGVTGLVSALIGAVIGWALWALIVYVVGTKVMPEPQTKADFPEVLRTIGFSAAPGVLNLFAIVPVLGFLVSLVASLWQLAAMVVAVRQALDYQTTGKAVLVCVIGWLGYVVAIFFVGSLLGISAALT